MLKYSLESIKPIESIPAVELKSAGNYIIFGARRIKEINIKKTGADEIL